jgi:methyl-accepting chemotaxis protein
MSTVSNAHSSVVRSASTLQHRILLGAGVGGAALVLALAWGADVAIGRLARRDAESRLVGAARRAQVVVDQALDDRKRQAEVLALSPIVVAAAREGADRATALHLDAVAPAELEQRYAAERSLQVAPAARAFLAATLPRLGAGRIALTERHGLTAVATRQPDHFVHGDDAWWQTAWQDGATTAIAAFDSTLRRPVVSVVTVVKDGDDRLGVLDLAVDATPLIAALGSAADGIRIDVVDSTSRIVLSSDSLRLGHLLPGMAGSRAESDGVSAVYDAGTERAVRAHANAGQWRLLAHQSAAALVAPYRPARLVLASLVAVLLVLLVAVLAALHQFLQRRITGPATELAVAAEAVAAGDFSVEIARTASDDEMGRLGRAVAAMIAELRRLAHALSDSARETSNMSSEITAGSEEMAATAGEIANTASDLSAQATTMAETIASLAQSAASLKELATTLDDGARGGSSRNVQLRALALENRAGLDAAAGSLGVLGNDVLASAQAIESLGAASEEIRSFVGLVRKLARQSKLLALNAAMEAARAGEHGEGFAVVASEVRRLAAMSSEAAERTEEIVAGVLSAIQESRASAARAVSTADEVRGATARASDSFTEIEMAVVEAEAWTASVEQTSAETSNLVADMTHRLESLAAGTESFAAAMEQVAASSEEQSASTQEIAAAAATLASAAERLQQLVANLKLGDAGSAGAPASPSAPSPVRLAKRREHGRAVSLAPAS